MKKNLFIATLLLLSIGCMAQKANVRKAKNLTLQENPDYAEARQVINEALSNDETKDQAETWYVAGLIGYSENEQARTKRYLGQTVDEESKGQAVLESYNYWLRADELAMIPTYDKKGNPKYDTKTRKNIQTRLLEYYEKGDLINYGAYLNDQHEYNKAYSAFITHLSIPDLPMMQEPKLQAKMQKDTLYVQYKFYAAIFAVQSQMHKEAIVLLNELKDGEYEAENCYKFLYEEYVALQDTVNYVSTLQEATQRFPQQPWFLQNLINHYIFSGQEQTAIEYLAEAIEREPNVAEYHYIRGNLNARQGNNDAAMADYDKALEINPDMADAVAGKGGVYYYQAVKMNEDAAYINDAKEYQKALEEMNAMYKRSLPFYEQAHEMRPDDRDIMITLRTLYYRFNMTDKYNAIQAELNK